MAATARTVPSPHQPGAPRLRAVGLGWLALTALAIAVFAPLQYVLNPLSELAANGGEIAVNYAPRPGWVRIAFYTHIVFGGLALLLSPVQLSSRVRARVPRLHRVNGRVVLVSIALAGTAGFLLSWFNTAGPIGTAGFGTLAVLWVIFAGLGLRAILRRDVAAHRRWMLRAFALTYAAVTLRLWLIALIPLLGDFASAYALVPFLCWVPNLVVVELLLRRSRTDIASTS
jgi:Predicted membrane protein (DUF2306)